MAPHFQTELAKFIEKIKPHIVVETGVMWGDSARAMLPKLLPSATLYSVEYSPSWPNLEDIKENPQWRMREGSSLDELPAIAIEQPGWDVFLHDSDHDVECQTFEYEFAYHMVKPGGYILSDDYTWGGHEAWQKFVTRHTLPVLDTLGSCAVALKPRNRPDPITNSEEIEAITEMAWKLSHEAAKAFGDEPRYWRK